MKSDIYEKLRMVALPQIRCQLQDHAMAMTKVMHVTMMMVEVAWQYISEWLWKCHDR